MLRHLLSRLLPKKNRKASSANGRPRCVRPVIEHLENRLMPSASAMFNSSLGVLTVHGDANNQIALTCTGAGAILFNGNAISGSPTLQDMKEIDVLESAGTNTISVNLPTYGGKVIIQGGTGLDKLFVASLSNSLPVGRACYTLASVEQIGWNGRTLPSQDKVDCFQIAPDGSIISQTEDGRLFRSTPSGITPLDTSAFRVAYFKIGPDGTIWTQGRGDYANLIRCYRADVPPSDPRFLFGAQDGDGIEFQLAPDGTVIARTVDNKLERFSFDSRKMLTREWLDTTAYCIAYYKIAPDGTIWTQGTGDYANLIRCYRADVPPSDPRFLFGAQDGDGVEFQLAADGTVIARTVDNKLERFAFDGRLLLTRTWLDTTAYRIGYYKIGPDGTIWTQGTGDYANVIRCYRADVPPSDPRFLFGAQDGDGVDFQLAPDGTAIARTVDNKLERFTFDDNSLLTRTWLDTTAYRVAYYDIGPDGTIWTQGSGDYYNVIRCYRADVPSSDPRFLFGAQDGDGVEFQLATDGTVIARTVDSKLERFSFDGNLLLTRSWLGLSGVRDIASSGGHILVEFEAGLRATLSVGFAAGAGSARVSLNNIQFDISAFTSNILAPIVSSVQKVTRPLDHLAHFLVDPIPGLSAISSSITVASLMRQPVIARVARAIIAIDNISLPSDTGRIDLGSITCLDSNSETPGTLSILSRHLTSFSSQITGAFAGFRQEARQIGLNFPVLDNPTNLVSLLTGHNVTLFTYKLPSFNLPPKSFKPLLGTYTFMAGPVPVTVNVFGDIGVSAHINSATFGCDSAGLFSGHLLDSFFVSNLSAGLDFHAGLIGQITVLGIVGVDVAGGVSAHADFSVYGAGGSPKLYGTDLVNGTVSVAISGNVSAYVDVSAWYWSLFLGWPVKIPVQLAHFDHTLFNL